MSQPGKAKWAREAGSLAAKIYPSANFNTPAASGWMGISGAGTLNTVDFDYHPGTAQATTASGVLTARVAGLHLVHAQIGLPGAITGLKGLTILRNGALTGRHSGHMHWTDDTSSNYKATSALVPLTVGQTVSIGFYNPTAVARTIDAAWTALSFQLVRPD